MQRAPAGGAVPLHPAEIAERAGLSVENTKRRILNLANCGAIAGIEVDASGHRSEMSRQAYQDYLSRYWRERGH